MYLGSFLMMMMIALTAVASAPVSESSGDAIAIPQALQMSAETSESASTLAAPQPFDFPVDFVFTWYNSKDTSVRAKYESRRAAVDAGSLAKDALSPARYTDAGELKYALRSVASHAPWVRNVHILLADDMQLPDWLNPNSEKIKIVRHSQILPRENLPTFNSHAIESALHHIPGIASQFVYFNDDMFINKPVDKSLFFSPQGKPMVWEGYSGPYKDGSHDAAVKNTFQILNGNNYPLKRWKRLTDLHHQAKAISVAAMTKVETEFRKDIDRTRASPFRTKADVWAILLASVVCVETDGCRKASAPKSSFNMLGKMTPKEAFASIRRENPTLVCVNDSDEKTAEKLTAELEQSYPHRSPFEI